MSTAPDINLELADQISQFYADPLGFVKFAYPWGEPGPLEGEEGPDEIQAGFLSDLGALVRERKFNGTDAVMPIRMAQSSGHGCGKSVQGAWIADWLMSTRPHSIGTVTAGTFTQLESRTWAAIQYWTKLCITAHWFRIGATGLYSKSSPQDWKVLAQTCRPDNAQAFAGQHARRSTSWYMADEASEVPDSIFEVMEGGLVDGEPMIFIWGQPVRASGYLHRVCFGSEREYWNVRNTDSRRSRFTNKALIEEWRVKYGEDADFFRVRVLGLAPSSGDLQYIDSERVYAAQKRPNFSLADDPLICGLDVARGGGDFNVFRFRKGLDARSIPAIRIPGEQTRDTMVLVSKAAELLGDTRPERKIAMMFVDAAFGGPVVNRLNQLGFKNVQEVNFGSASPDPHQANMRAYMWAKMKDWLLLGAIDKDPRLESDLCGPGFHHNNRDQLVIESKEDMQKRGLHSTDDGDAECLTHARHVAPIKKPVSASDYTSREVGLWS